MYLGYIAIILWINKPIHWMINQKACNMTRYSILTIPRYIKDVLDMSTSIWKQAVISTGNTRPSRLLIDAILWSLWSSSKSFHRDSRLTLATTIDGRTHPMDIGIRAASNTRLYQMPSLKVTRTRLTRESHKSTARALAETFWDQDCGLSISSKVSSGEPPKQLTMRGRQNTIQRLWIITFIVTLLLSSVAPTSDRLTPCDSKGSMPNLCHSNSLQPAWTSRCIWRTTRKIEVENWKVRPPATQWPHWEARQIPNEETTLDDTSRPTRNHVAENWIHAKKIAGQHHRKKSASSPKMHNNNWTVSTAVPKKTAGEHTRRGSNVTKWIIRHRPWKQLDDRKPPQDATIRVASAKNMVATARKKKENSGAPYEYECHSRPWQKPTKVDNWSHPNASPPRVAKCVATAINHLPRAHQEPILCISQNATWWLCRKQCKTHRDMA